MRVSLCCTLLTVSISAALFSACFGHVRQGEHVVSQTANTRITESAVDITDLVVNLTLEHFWNLANLQIRDPSAAPRLLETDPRDPAKSLGPLKVGFDAYQKQLARGAGVKPLILFMPHGADPEEEARRHSLPITLGPPPPAFFSGPTVDTLIVFEPVNSARREPTRGGPVALARIASAAGLTGLWLAEGGRSPEQLGFRLYQVQPREWKKAAVFEHIRCLFPSPGVKLATRLFYQGGFTADQTVTVADKDWGPCTLDPNPSLRAATVKQPGNRKPGSPAIIAGSYDLNPQPGLFLSDWISVK